MNDEPARVPLGIDGYSEAVLIGRGGYGRVYRARQTAFDRIVAIKVLDSDEEVGGASDVERYAVGAVSGHPQVVTVLDSGIDDSGRPYIVMEHLPEGSLADRLRDRGPLPWAEAIAIGIKLAGAVETAHRLGVLHRDIKPENVLVAPYGEPKLSDFGIAQLAATSHTHSGSITGTLSYLAPEVLNGDAFSEHADVYALAAMTFCLIDGEPPFTRTKGEPLASLVARIVTSSPRSLDDAVPEAVRQALAIGLSKDPLDRPASAASFGTSLQRAQMAVGEDPTGMFVDGSDEGAAGFALAGRLSEDDARTISRPLSSLLGPISHDGRRWRLGRPVGAAALLLPVIAAISIGLSLGGPTRTRPPQRPIAGELAPSPEPSSASLESEGSGNLGRTDPHDHPSHKKERRHHRAAPVTAAAPVVVDETSEASADQTTQRDTGTSADKKAREQKDEEPEQLPPNYPLYHLYNRDNDDHYYTYRIGDRTEKMAYGYNPAGVEGRIYAHKKPYTIPLISMDGLVGYVFQFKRAGTIPLYYLKKGNTKDLFTSSAEDRDAAVEEGYRYVSTYGWVGPP